MRTLAVCVAFARIQGAVRLAALIDEEGQVERLKLISGHPLLVNAAFHAVKRWRYRPLIRKGVPVAVATIIEVSFTLGAWPPAERPGRTRTA